jgi:predicted DNA-binding transcriptional regulator AlpA
MTSLDGLTIPQKLARLGRGIDARVLAQLLGVSAVSIYRQAAARTIPSYRIGTALRFDPSSVATTLFGEQ